MKSTITASALWVTILGAALPALADADTLKSLKCNIGLAKETGIGVKILGNPTLEVLVPENGVTFLLPAKTLYEDADFRVNVRFFTLQEGAPLEIEVLNKQENRKSSSWSPNNLYRADSMNWAEQIDQLALNHKTADVPKTRWVEDVASYFAVICRFK